MLNAASLLYQTDVLLINNFHKTFSARLQVTIQSQILQYSI